MSFSSIFKNIWKGVQLLEPIAQQVVPNFIPGSAAVFTMIDPIFHNSLDTIVTSEINNPASGNGPAKLTSAVNAFTNQDYITEMQSIAAQSGMKLIWDDAALKAGLSAQADAYNLLAKAKASMKLVPITPAP